MSRRSARVATKQAVIDEVKQAVANVQDIQPEKKARKPRAKKQPLEKAAPQNKETLQPVEETVEAVEAPVEVKEVKKTSKELNANLQSKEAKEYMKISAQEVMKPRTKKFKRSVVLAYTVDDIWSADLADMQDVAEDNDGYKYMLNIVDVLTKYAWEYTAKE